MTSSQNVLNTLQPGSGEGAVGSSSLDVSRAGSAIGFGHLVIAQWSENRKSVRFLGKKLEFFFHLNFELGDVRVT